MSAVAAARSVFWSTAVTRSAGARLAGGDKPKAARSTFCVPTWKPHSSCIFRSPVEMSSVCVDLMLPFHNARASALLTSMLSVTPRCYSWTPEVMRTENVLGLLCLKLCQECRLVVVLMVGTADALAFFLPGVLCVHSAKKVRDGLLAAIRGLLSKCNYTLKESRLMLLASWELEYYTLTRHKGDGTTSHSTKLPNRCN